jgi:hypothetical protein
MLALGLDISVQEDYLLRNLQSCEEDGRKGQRQGYDEEASGGRLKGLRWYWSRRRTRGGPGHTCGRAVEEAAGKRSVGRRPKAGSATGLSFRTDRDGPLRRRTSSWAYGEGWPWTPLSFTRTTKPNPSTPWGRATSERAVRLFQEWPTCRAGSGRLFSTPLDTPRRAHMDLSADGPHSDFFSALDAAAARGR